MKLISRSLNLRLSLLVIAMTLTYQPASAQSRIVESWIDFRFEVSTSMGDPRNPVVILPAGMAELLGDVTGNKRSGTNVFIPAAEFQRLAKQPLAAIVMGPVLRQVSNVKSFDGFNAVDMTGLVRNLTSEIIEAPDAVARKTNPQDLNTIRRQLRNGDIIFAPM